VPVVASDELIVTLESQLSVAVAEPSALVLKSSPHIIVVFDGQLMTGTVVSTIEIVCVALVLLPQRSVAVQMRVIVEASAQAPLVTV
jgi:hypothetical protein